MSAHDWYVENRAAFVTRALEPDEERQLEASAQALLATQARLGL